MSDILLVDDHVLLRILLGEEPRELRAEHEAIATTGLWYHRMCRALSDDGVVGSMSRRLSGVGVEVASAVIASVIELPGTVELVSFRSLGWPMAKLVNEGVRLNLLSLEAVAAAQQLSADICLAAVDDNQPLRSAAVDVGILVRTIPG